MMEKNYEVLMGLKRICMTQFVNENVQVEKHSHFFDIVMEVPVAFVLKSR